MNMGSDYDQLQKADEGLSFFTHVFEVYNSGVRPLLTSPSTLRMALAGNSRPSHWFVAFGVLTESARATVSPNHCFLTSIFSTVAIAEITSKLSLSIARRTSKALHRLNIDTKNLALREMLDLQDHRKFPTARQSGRR